MSNADVAKNALIVSVAQAVISILTGGYVPYAVMNSVMAEMKKREERQEETRLAERREDRADRVAERREDRILVVAILVAAACLAVYLKG